MNVLVIAPHPDDEVLGCGGTISRLNREAATVHVAFLTEGASTQYPDQPELVETRNRNAREAIHRLGGGTLTFWDLPDMSLSLTPPTELNGRMTELVNELRPDWVLGPAEGDLNVDHRYAFEAMCVACRPREDHPTRVASYEIPGSTDWGPSPFLPTLFVGLEEEDVDRKIEALQAYETEVGSWPHPRSPEAVRHVAALRGMQCGKPLAEAFHLVRERM